MELFLGETKDPKSLSTSTGVRITVFNKSSFVFIGDGIYVGTGTQSNVAISRSFTTLLEKPYSECVENIESNPSKSKLAFFKKNLRHVLLFLNYLSILKSVFIRQYFIFNLIE
jgi:hypothetical protein